MKQNKNVSRGTLTNKRNEKEDFQERGPIPFFSVCRCFYWLLTLPLRNPSELLDVQTNRHQRTHYNRDYRHDTHQSQHTT